jgi:hypothetical protein
VLDTLLDGFEAQASQLAAPFPEEPVGVGARWRVTSSFDLAGLPFEVATELTLDAVGDGVADGSVALTMTIPPGPVEVQGAQLEVVSGTMTGSGSVHWDLALPLAVVDQEMAGEVVMQAAGTELRQVLRQRYRVAPV